MSTPLIELQHLNVTFGRRGLFRRRQGVEAVVDVSLQIQEGEIVALVGESGCGKTTLGRVIAGLQRPTSGSMRWQGQSIHDMSRATFMGYQLGVQIVHQDSFAALNPVRTILQTLSAPLREHHLARSGREAREKAAYLLQSMGLTPAEMFLDKYPHQLSGGQRQRVVLARAMSAEPRLIVADEPVSMTDVSLRLSILNLMSELNAQRGLAFLYITHDLATARYFAQRGRIVVMYLGDVVELGPLGEVLESPLHPYLRALLSAVLVPDPRITRQKRELPLTSLELPDPTRPPPGCRFHTRCPYAQAICSREHPANTRRWNLPARPVTWWPAISGQSWLSRKVGIWRSRPSETEGRMNPLAGRVAFSMGLTVFLLALITLPFLDPSSPEFVADAIALALSGIFVGLVVCSARRAARLPAIERLPDDVSRPGRPDDDIDQPG